MRYLPGVVLLAAATASAQTAEQDVSRVADMASIAAKEYAIGVVDGVVVSPAEVEEAELFLVQATSIAQTLTGRVSVVVGSYLDSLKTSVESRAHAPTVNDLLQRFRSAIVDDLGIALLTAPAEAPSLYAGRQVYESNCSSCHGVTGDGNGPASAGLEPAPAVLNDRAALSDLSVLDFFRVTRVGVQGTAMPSFEETLTEEQRWAVSLYASSLRHGNSGLGREFLEANCRDCLARFSNIGMTFNLSDDSLRALSAGLATSDTPDSVVDAAAGYARIAGAAEELGGSQEWKVRGVLSSVRESLGRAATLGLAGRSAEAVDSSVAAYIQFEGIEADLRAGNSSGVRNAETLFTLFRSELDGSPDDVRRAHSRLDEALVDLGTSIEGGWTTKVLFGKSFVIMLREGMEAILIVGALMTVVVRTGAPERQNDIVKGVVVALVASVATAILFGTILKNAITSQEAVEGITMLVAALVLFWVSYWLVSKIEIAKWQQFVKNQVTRALASRSSLALAGVAFLAVYREGFETVLFYSALYTGAETSAASAGISAGLLAGLGALGIVYFAIRRYGLRIPLKPFFAATSALLYLMAFSFAGQGVSELQAAGYLPANPISWLPSIPWLGIYPTAQTMTVQLLLAAALAFAMIWIFVVSPQLLKRASIRN